MGIFTYLKIAGAAVIIIALGYLIWNYNHMQSVIATQAKQIAELKLVTEIVSKAQDTTRKQLNAMQATQRRVTREQETLAQEAVTVPNSDLDSLYDRYRVH